MPGQLELFFVLIIVPAAGSLISTATLGIALTALFSAFTLLPKRHAQLQLYRWARICAVLLTLWVALGLVLALLSLCPVFTDCSDSVIVVRRHILIINTVIESTVLVLVLALQIRLVVLCRQAGDTSPYLIYILALNVPLGLSRAILREFHDDPSTEYRADAAIFSITFAMRSVYLLIAAVSFFVTRKTLRRGEPFGLLRTVAALSLLRHLFGIIQPFFFPFDHTVDFFMFSSLFVTLTATVCFKLMIDVAVEYSLDDPEEESRRPLLPPSEQGTNETLEA